MFEFLQTAQFFTGFNIADLTFLAEFTAATELPIDNALIKNRGASQ